MVSSMYYTPLGPIILIMSTQAKRDQVRSKFLSAWRSVVEELAPSCSTISWTALPDIVRVLALVGRQAPDNATILPLGTMMDLTRAAPSSEPGCVELGFGFDDGGRVVRPAELQLVVPEGDPLREFAYFRLKLAPLAPSGVSDETTLPFEEVVEVSPGEYVNFSQWEEGTLGPDADGDELPMPAEARRVVRHFNGVLVITSKGSWLESNAENLRHNERTAAEFRAGIEKVLGQMRRQAH